MKRVQKIEDSQLWRNVSSIAHEVYGLLPELPDEERMGMQLKLRQRSFDATDDVAAALGSIDPRDVKWYFSHVRRDLFGLKNGLSMAYKVGYLEAKPELMLKLDKVVDEIDVVVAEATKDIPIWMDEMQLPVKGPSK